jgi:hypothetical protein
MSIQRDIRVNAEVIREHQVINKLKLLDKSPGSISNIISGFNQMIKAGLLPTPIRKEYFQLPYYAKLKRNIRTHSKLNGKGKQWSSFVNDIQLAVLSSDEIDFTESTLSELLISLLSDTFGPNISKSVMMKMLKEDAFEFSKEQPVYKWLSGTDMPRNSKEGAATIARLDTITNADGMLIKKYRQYYPFQTAPRNKRSLDDTPHNFKGILKQNEDFEAWKMDGTLPTYVPTQWQGLASYDLIRVKPQLKDRWTENSQGTCNASINRIRTLTQLAKSYRQYKTDIKEEEILFHHFFDIHFIDYHFSNCIQNSIYKSALRDFRALGSACTPNSFESFYFIPDGANPERWEKELQALAVYTRAKQGEINNISTDLDGARHIRFIINSDDPEGKVNAISDFLFEAQYTHTKLAPKISALSMSFYWELCRSCPLRVENFVNLKWLGELSNTQVDLLEAGKKMGVYKRISDGNYYVFVHFSHLKNKKVKGTVSIHQNISYMNSLVETLIAHNYQYFKEKGRKNFDYLIFGLIEAPSKFPGSSFSHRFKNNTYTAICYLFPEVESTGINPHAMRHLAATLYLRDNPKDYVAVSTMLMDTLETVIRVYAKVDNKKNAQSIHDWVSRKLSAVA